MDERITYPRLYPIVTGLSSERSLNTLVISVLKIRTTARFSGEKSLSLTLMSFGNEETRSVADS